MSDRKLPPENKVFCMAPWTHTFISPQSERRLCCASREDHSFQKQYIDSSRENETPLAELTDEELLERYNPEKLADYWNSEYMRNIRLAHMRGEKIPQCQVCNDNILMEGGSYRGWFNGLFKDQIQEAYDSTDETGYTTMEPVSFDYRVSNLCNFKCRMCGEQLSSSWEAEKRQQNCWTRENEVFMVPAVNEAIETFQREVVDEELRDAAKRGIVKELYWVGGEPLLYDIHWEVLDLMVANGSAKDCVLRYNSNLSKIHNKQGKSLYEYVEHFKSFVMCASIDATGDIVEYIRTGIKWDVWLENFEKGLELPGGKDKMIIDLTITAPGMFGLKELFDLSLQHDVRIETKITFAFDPRLMWTPLSWPREVLDEVVDDLLEYIEPKATHKQQSLIDNLRSLKTRKTHAEAWPDTYAQEAVHGKRWVERIESWRPNTKLTMRDIYSNHPKLVEWWDNINGTE